MRTLSFLGIAVIGIVLSSCNQSKNENVQSAPQSEEEVIKRGAYLVDVIGCGDCHSPKKFTEFGPVPDQERLFSGHPADLPLGPINKGELQNWVLFGFQNTVAIGPWGASFAGNITSDATGIGNWSYEQFKIALTKGKFKGIEGARDLMPPMPWPNYSKLAEGDLKAIYAYLKSTKPIRNIVPAPLSPDQL